MRRFLAVFLLLLLAGAGHAVIKALLPLESLLGNSHYVFVAKVEKFFADKPAMVLNVVDDLKGKAPFRRMPVNLAADKEADKKFQPEILKRLGDDLEVVFFVNHRGKQLTTFAYSNGTWFHILGQQTGKDTVAWRFMNGEPFLRRTFKGSNAELKAILADAIAGKKKPPEVNEKEPSGFGPVYEKKSSAVKPADRSVAGRVVLSTGLPGLFAVIPTLGVGGPIAILAILFPTVFGGVLVLFRQWIAFITLLSVNSTLILLHFLLGDSFRGSWLAEQATLWIVMAGVNLLCFLWAWRRQIDNVSLGSAAMETPERTENIVLVSLGAIMLGLLVLVLWLSDGDLHDINNKLVLVLAAGVWLALFVKAFKTVRNSRSLAVPLSTEGVMLVGCLAASLYFFVGQGGNVEATVFSGDAGGSLQISFDGKERWQYVVAPETGGFVSTPFVAADRVYAASAHPSFKFGILHCVDRSTGKLLWKFDDDGAMKQVYSSPTVVDGRLYIGEGFHDDPDCKLYCIDAVKGTKVWDFETKGQTECTPAVALGRVFFGAGNVGFYCVDAETGKNIHWSFPPKGYKGRLLRFCGNPIVANGRVYVGTGVDRNQTEDKGRTAVFCFDARSGALIWDRDVPIPCWAAPVLDGDRLYVALGNGDIVADAEHYDSKVKNHGAIVCLDAESGRKIWTADLPNGVINEAAVDEDHVYCGSRDGNCYCLRKSDGRPLWERGLFRGRSGTAVVASPALARLGERTESVVVVSNFGRRVSLDPRTGKEQWSTEEWPGECHFTANPRVVATRAGRQIFIAGAVNGDLTRGRPTLFCLEDRVSEK
ncbi:MAG: PQQ-binding-like beta-propeller repeat protein [Gemmataceae bacterium]